MHEEILNHVNLVLETVVTPVDYVAFGRLLRESQYPEEKVCFLIQGFKNGFDIGYQGPTDVSLTAPNLKIRIGSHVQLWNKVMREVGHKRYAGSFKHPPFQHFIQSPIGLVPKDQGKDTRLIFHLSYPKGGSMSVNANTPRHLCSVKYPDMDYAIRMILAEEEIGDNKEFVYLSKCNTFYFLVSGSLSNL